MQSSFIKKFFNHHWLLKVVPNGQLTFEKQDYCFDGYNLFVVVEEILRVILEILNSVLPFPLHR